jgi:TatD DNase family protein
MGLDFFKEYSPRAQQVRVFERQLEMARELDLPIVIHERAAQNEVFSMLKSLGPKELQGVIHCFSGNYKLAMKYIDLGFMISIPGIVTFKKAEILKDVARRIPIESLLLETDSPFLTPEPFRGRPNEPSMVVWTAKEIARLRNISLEELTRETTKNVQRLFKIGK